MVNHKSIVQNLSKCLIIFLGLLFFASCNLNEDTSGIISPDNFYKTSSDLDASVIAMYSSFQDIYRHPICQLVLMPGDDITTRPGANKQQFRNYDRFNYSAVGGWLKGRNWTWYWNTIHSANTILANYKQADVSEEKKDRVAGQAYFMRGLSYYFLVRMFGGVPEITTPETTGKEKRASMQEIYQLIEKDLKKAEDRLPSQWENAAGKATSGAAKTALASVYLTWASWPLQDESKYAMAAQKAQEVMDSETYGLLKNFADLWKEKNDNSKESIFSLQYNIEADEENRFSQGNRPFEEQGWNDVEAEIDFFNRFPEGPRKKATFQTTIDGTNWEKSQFGHPYYKKWTVAGRRASGGFFFSSKNIDIFRYAEVLLIYAEATNKAKGPIQSAYNAINRVRNRAGLSDLPTGLSKAEFHEAVIKERAWELAAEFSRWFDLVRNEMVEQIPKLRDDAELSLINQPRQKEHAFAKIPQEDIDLNPNLIQNPKGNKVR